MSHDNITKLFEEAQKNGIKSIPILENITNAVNELSNNVINIKDTLMQEMKKSDISLEGFEHLDKMFYPISRPTQQAADTRDFHDQLLDAIFESCSETQKKTPCSQNMERVFHEAFASLLGLDNLRDQDMPELDSDSDSDSDNESEECLFKPVPIPAPRARQVPIPEVREPRLPEPPVRLPTSISTITLSKSALKELLDDTPRVSASLLDELNRHLFGASANDVTRKALVTMLSDDAKKNARKLFCS